MKKIWIGCFAAAFLTACAVPNKHPLKIESTPPGALISIHETRKGVTGDYRRVAGVTPVEKTFDFKNNEKVWVELEKRGYENKLLEATPQTGTLTVTLDRLTKSDGSYVEEFVLPSIHRLLLIEPDVKIIHRGFSSEKVSKKDSEIAQKKISSAVQDFFKDKYDVLMITPSRGEHKRFRAVWRDARTMLALADPIRLNYQRDVPLLETKSSRRAVRQLARQFKGEAILLVTGKQNIETTGMIAGKIGMSALATATSYTSSYHRALASGQSTFSYTIYEPKFAEGTSLKAILIDGESGEVLWINKGKWGPVQLGNPEQVDIVMTDLLTNFP